MSYKLPKEKEEQHKAEMELVECILLCLTHPTEGKEIL